MKQIIGPFTQMITFRHTALKGPLKASDMYIVENAGVCVDSGFIVEVGPFEDLVKNKAISSVMEISSSHVLIPGLIDCHTHMVWAGSRAADFERRNSGLSYQEILASGGGILDTVKWVGQATKEDLKNQLHQRIIRHQFDGVTTQEIKSGYGLDAQNELKMLEVIQEVNRQVEVDLIPTFLGAHVCPKGYERVAYLDYLLSEVAPKAKLMTNRADAFVEAEAFPVHLAQPYLMGMKKLGFDLTLHADQFSRGGAALAVQIGAKSADHLESTTFKDIHLLGTSNTVAVVLPGASLGLGMAFAPTRALLDAGACLAIASDWNPGSAPNGDLLAQCGILAAYEKLTAAETFSGITFRAAQALGLTDRGRLAPNYLFDAIAFPTHDYREILYQQGTLKPDIIWKKGDLLIDGTT
ncbi:MAG: imidazolonepropionase [Flammeovirgaceae bacterium]|nr:imidazolonepropionase [Flammeovirgaceae bacterium]